MFWGKRRSAPVLGMLRIDRKVGRGVLQFIGYTTFRLCDVARFSMPKVSLVILVGLIYIIPPSFIRCVRCALYCQVSCLHTEMLTTPVHGIYRALLYAVSASNLYHNRNNYVPSTSELFNFVSRVRIGDVNKSNGPKVRGHLTLWLMAFFVLVTLIHETSSSSRAEGCNSFVLLFLGPGSTLL